jgi:UDPglucose--hexose-1-phosphate uridylyltransferase
MLSDQTHRRYNPLLDEWLLVSPHRTQRPWQGKVEEINIIRPPDYEKECYLCPNNKRASGKLIPITSLLLFSTTISVH